jgi:CheY-like chemotaxis protein
MSQQPSTQDTPPSFQGTIVLIVEDNQINHMVLEQQLLKMQCESMWAQTGEEGFKLFTENTFDCVFMDCMLPGISGLECTEQIRQYEKQNTLIRTPVIALTADVRDSNKQACFDADMDDFMGKPFKFADLNNILKLWIHR